MEQILQLSLINPLHLILLWTISIFLVFFMHILKFHWLHYISFTYYYNSTYFIIEFLNCNYINWNPSLYDNFNLWLLCERDLLRLDLLTVSHYDLVWLNIELVSKINLYQCEVVVLIFPHTEFHPSMKVSFQFMPRNHSYFWVVLWLKALIYLYHANGILQVKV